MEPRKQAICDALARWVKQRPGLEFGNYGDIAAYRSEQRSIARDKREAETLLAAVRWRDGITADMLKKAAESAFSGRLSIKCVTVWPGKDATPRYNIDYCTGQYWPTEYRRAVCAVLASALWEYTRVHAMPAPIGYRAESWPDLQGRTYGLLRGTRVEAESDWAERGGSEWGHVNKVYDTRGNSAGDWLRAHFRKEFGRGLASRWFS
jgi:hypothetical protein